MTGELESRRAFAGRGVEKVRPAYEALECTVMMEFWKSTLEIEDVLEAIHVHCRVSGGADCDVKVYEGCDGSDGGFADCCGGSG